MSLKLLNGFLLSLVLLFLMLISSTVSACDNKSCESAYLVETQQHIANQIRRANALKVERHAYSMNRERRAYAEYIHKHFFANQIRRINALNVERHAYSMNRERRAYAEFIHKYFTLVKRSI